MTDEFKKKLDAYEKGELTGSELEQFEHELEKLEIYQQHLGVKETTNEKPAKETITTGFNDKKQRKILKRSKWKARIQTAFTALILFLGILIVTSILTAVYYSWGTPNRSEVLSNVIDHTLTVTQPDGHLGGTSINAKTFFRMEATRDIRKRVGNETITVGDMKINFLFSMMSFPEISHYGRQSQNRSIFYHPSATEVYAEPDWHPLEQLPEGTVASAYLSFDQLYGTNEVFQLFEGKDLDLSWLAVDTGPELNDPFHSDVILDPIGFPSYPIWHEDDMIVTSRSEEKGFLFGRIVTESSMSPDYEVGDETVLHEQFLKTLSFLEPHEAKANRLAFNRLNLTERIQYLKTEGIFHYGVVITGPTKEILALREEPWITTVEVDEVTFWNWHH
ncbi:anti-sigma factor [Alkalihalobacterium chitinilyticum]|uniref:Anti-sigma factor n=1 Tax=Alkalihalobacterium chitinilyticum TaxID=2980103 RepID=A0ABT5VF44_9BACI|nr:anti-sigma factor [Alkalihalobacterium chitinilyticum]MDE5414085.1 anti-sigma factor [Alkalihalobacterium chitinilyticum]